MTNVRKETEIAVHLEGNPKAVDRLLGLVNAWGMKVCAYCCYFTDTETIALLVTSDGDQTYRRL